MSDTEILQWWNLFGTGCTRLDRPQMDGAQWELRFRDPTHGYVQGHRRDKAKRARGVTFAEALREIVAAHSADCVKP